MSRIAAAFLCGAIALTPTLGWSGNDAALEELVVEMADTPEQHAALAEYYSGKAAEANSEASRHERMADSYGAKKATQRNRMKKHCKEIAAQYTAMAAQFEELAKLHDAESK